MTNNPRDYVGIYSGAHFDGATYSPVKDHVRLTGLLHRVFAVMSDGNWHRLSELANRCNGSEASTSARIRDLRKDKFGGFQVDRKRHTKGLFLYRLVLEPQKEMF